MKRRLFFPLIAAALAGAWLAQAQPAPRANVFITAAASTPQNKTPYTISVEVTVENRGQADSNAGNLELILKPQGSTANKPTSSVPTMWDPVSQSQPLPVLKPGEKKVLQFGTPYASSSSFRNRSGSFKVSNIDPTGGDVTVTMTATLR